MEKDLTIIFITASQIKKKFADFQWKTLKEATKGYPIIRITRDQNESAEDWGVSAIVYDNEPKSLSNIYRQILRAAKIAKTPYVAIAEDDSLYHENHFNFYRPDMDTFAYNQNRFALFTWGEPLYSWRNRKSNCSLIAPRELLIEALEERFAKYPNGTPDHITGEVGRGMVERNMGITVRKSVEVFGEVSIIQLNHESASEERQVNKRKRLGQIKVWDIYYWGRPWNILKHYEN